MRHLQKQVAFATLAMALALGMGCPAFDQATGFTPAVPAVAAKPAVTNPDGSVTPATPAIAAKPATVDVVNSPVGKTLNAVDEVGSVTPVGPLIHLGVTGILGLLSIIGFVRGGQWKNAAIATGQGLQNVVSSLDAAHAVSPSVPVVPSQVADLIKKAVDLAHDDHGVSQGLQNALTPIT